MQALRKIGASASGYGFRSRSGTREWSACVFALLAARTRWRQPIAESDLHGYLDGELAAADRVAGMLEGQPLAALDSLDMQALAAELELPREKFGKLLRLEDALMACRAATGQRKT